MLTGENSRKTVDHNDGTTDKTVEHIYATTTYQNNDLSTLKCEANEDVLYHCTSNAPNIPTSHNVAYNEITNSRATTSSNHYCTNQQQDQRLDDDDSMTENDAYTDSNEEFFSCHTDVLYDIPITTRGFLFKEGKFIITKLT